MQYNNLDKEVIVLTANHLLPKIVSSSHKFMMSQRIAFLDTSRDRIDSLTVKCLLILESIN